MLDEAIAARLVTDVPGAPGRMRFMHALVRDTLYDALPHVRRLELHRRAGEAIEAIAGDDPPEPLGARAPFLPRAARGRPRPGRRTCAARGGAGDAAARPRGGRPALRDRAAGARAALPPDRSRERAFCLDLGDALARSGDMPRAQGRIPPGGCARTRRPGAAEDLAAAALGYGGRIVWARAGGRPLVVCAAGGGTRGASATRTRRCARGCSHGSPARSATSVTRRGASPWQEARGAQTARRRRRRAERLSFALAGLARRTARARRRRHAARQSPTELLAAAAAGRRQGERVRGAHGGVARLFRAERGRRRPRRAARVAAHRRRAATALAAVVRRRRRVDARRSTRAASTTPSGSSAEARELGGSAQQVEAAGAYAVQLTICAASRAAPAEALRALAAGRRR